ncbi:LysR family transcriptional regulator [Ferrimonas sp. SCSIO 43195]|uniref:LysR family transcriptional regulator n=1 Tax=Ferrimonas sp. SCSIO 43195 TaxID=2822844 RepID=UPI00207589AA|nr:LysR family transcriptional regulator [Ferrimonas sp. SCSIO 43195]USD38813.1 LysR family transcriptional regulator [Ferrimonas sp. SCSIO 43195]
MKLQIEAVRAFVAAAENGSFTAAGRELKKTQAAISQQVQNLEIDLGFDLFSRLGKYPVLTPKGTRLLKDARVMLSQVEHFSEQARAMEGNVEPSLRLGVDPLVCAPELVNLVSEFANTFPHIELSLFQQNSLSLSQKLKDNQLDAVLGLFPERDNIGYSAVDAFQVACHWVASPQLAESLGDPISYGALCHSRLLLPTNLPDRSLNPMTDQIQVWEVEDINTLLSFCRSGIGISCLPDFVVQHDLNADILRQVRFDFDRISKFSWRATMLWHKGYKFHEAGEWIFKKLTELKIK